MFVCVYLLQVCLCIMVCLCDDSAGLQCVTVCIVVGCPLVVVVCVCVWCLFSVKSHALLEQFSSGSVLRNLKRNLKQDCCEHSETISQHKKILLCVWILPDLNCNLTLKWLPITFMSCDISVIVSCPDPLCGTAFVYYCQCLLFSIISKVCFTHTTQLLSSFIECSSVQVTLLAR